MWQTDISVDRGSELGDAIERRLSHYYIRNTRAILDNRDIFSIASEDDRMRDELERVVRDILLIDAKMAYLSRHISVEDDLTRLLLAEMLFFDSKYENEYVDRILMAQYEYSIDGILHFKMHDLVDNWDYLLSLYDNISVDRANVLSLTKYIHDSSIDDEKRIYMTKRRDKNIIMDVRKGDTIDNMCLPSEDENMLYAIISTHVSEIFVDKRYEFRLSQSILNYVVSVKYV